MMKEIANEFEGKFGRVGEDKDKYKTFLVPIQKEIRKIDQRGNETFVRKIDQEGQFIASSSSNLTVGIHKIRSKSCDCFPEYKLVKGNLVNA